MNGAEARRGFIDYRPRLRLKRQRAVQITVGGLCTAGAHDGGDHDGRQYEATQCLHDGLLNYPNLWDPKHQPTAACWSIHDAPGRHRCGEWAPFSRRVWHRMRTARRHALPIIWNTDPPMRLRSTASLPGLALALPLALALAGALLAGCSPTPTAAAPQ